LFDLSDAPFAEVALNDTTANSTAAAAKKKLQTVLDQHPTAPAPTDTAEKAKKKAERKARKQASE
jgi:hypothetical protein